MCTHQRFIFNPYSRKNVLVKCGKCPSCQQEKAYARSNRIRNNLTDGTIALFFTLTYSNDYLPHILKDVLFEDNLNGDVVVYRNCSIRRVFDRHSGFTRWKKDNVRSVLGYVNSFDIDFTDIEKIPSPSGMPNSISVCWYHDIQDFFKRLRQYLIREKKYEKSFSYFSCSEYGSERKRSHFHGLLFVPREDETLFRSAIVACWPYADSSRTSKFIEVARDAANYVASYVASSASLPSLLQADFFKQKHSQSKHFGVVLDCFSLRSILQKIDSGDLFYYREQKFDGQSSVSPVPVPLYVLHRYFPLCKGFSWLDSCQLRSILLDPQKVGDILTDVEILTLYKRNIYDFDFHSNRIVNGLSLVHCVPIRRSCKLRNPLYHYTPKETYKIYIRLENCYRLFHEKTGLSRFDYAFYYERVYNLYFSMVMKCLHQDIMFLDDYADFYDNGFEFLDNPSISPTLSNLNVVADPNQRSFVISDTARNVSLFSRMDKQRRVTNNIMVRLGYNV